MVPLLAVLVLLLAPAGAHAATLAEVPPLNLRAGTACAGATGTPGEVATPTETGVRFSAATRRGFRRRQDVKLGERFLCQSVRTLPGGAGLIVGDDGGGTVAAVRDPGGAWSDPIDLSGSGAGFVSDIAAALSQRGDAVVAFKETPLRPRGGRDASRLYVARRAPGGAGFVPAEQFGAASKTAAGLQVGISATGEVIAVAGTLAGGRLTLSAAVAPAGASFGAPVTIGTTGWLASPVLQVAPDGRALLA